MFARRQCGEGGFAEPPPDPYLQTAQNPYLRPTQPPPLPATVRPVQPPVFYARPIPSGRSQRGWGIAAMIAGFAPALLLMALMAGPGRPAPTVVYVILALFLLLGTAGIGLYRAGTRRNRPQPPQPPQPPQLR